MSHTFKFRDGRGNGGKHKRQWNREDEETKSLARARRAKKRAVKLSDVDDDASPDNQDDSLCR